MKLSQLVSDHPIAAFATVAPPAVAAATWVTYVDVGVRVLVGLAAVIASLCAARYWWLRTKREQKYTDTESGL